MPDLGTQVRSYAAGLIAAAPPVTAHDARRLVRRRRRPAGALIVGIAAALLIVAGSSAVALHEEDDDAVTTTDQGPSDLGHDLNGHRDWLVALLNGAVEPDSEAFEIRFSDEFLDAVPAEEFSRVVEALGDSAPWVVGTEVERRDQTLAVQLVGADGQHARLTLATDDDDRMRAATILVTGRCGGLFSPDEVAPPPVVADRLSWVFDVVNSSRSLSDEELTTHLGRTFLEDVPLDEFRRRLDEIRALGPLTMRWFEDEPQPTELTARVGLNTGEEGRVRLVLADEEPHRIIGFTVASAQPCPLEG